MKTLHQPHYTPQDGQLINDIEKAWQRLENAEYHREVALREELLRQEKLEQLNIKFEKKSVLREGYLKEMIQVLSDPRYGASFSQVDATVKKHEAISADILARVERFTDLTAMANELEKENYHGKNRVKRRESEVLEKWRKLLALLENHKINLTQMSLLMSLLREIDATLISIHELKVRQTGSHAPTAGWRVCRINFAFSRCLFLRCNSAPKMSDHICLASRNCCKRMRCKSCK